MRVFQNISLYQNYLPRLQEIWSHSDKFFEMVDLMKQDRFGGVHYLKPVLDNSSEIFFTAGDNAQLQTRWAKENGLPKSSSLDDILCAQIENHRTEIFYNMDPVRYDNRFLKKLPGSVRRTIAWRAAPSGNAQFLEHDLVVNNYPSLAKQYEAQGARTAFFFPSHDPAMDEYAANEDRQIDILFIGGYTRHHMERAFTLEAISRLQDKYNVVFNLDVSRATNLAETPAGLIGPLRKLRRPKSIRKISQPPVFGLDMYRQISRAKIVINGKVDIAGQDRGNMRLWETLGCGATLLTDDGNYPEPMQSGKHFCTYADSLSLLANIEKLLNSPADRRRISDKGGNMVRENFSKTIHWEKFKSLCA